jgi:hypothetical protein
VHFLFIKLHADISPIPGHHGYQSGDPSGQGKAYLKGQQFHWLHHHYFECNYGSDLVPCGEQTPARPPARYPDSVCPVAWAIQLLAGGLAALSTAGWRWLN